MSHSLPKKTEHPKATAAKKAEHPKATAAKKATADHTAAKADQTAARGRLSAFFGVVWERRTCDLHERFQLHLNLGITILLGSLIFLAIVRMWGS